MVISMDGKKILAFVFVLLGWAPLEAQARRPMVELSSTVAYSKSNFTDGYKSTMRRHTGAVDFKFTPVSAIQFEYTQSITKISHPTNVGGQLPYFTQEATSYKDRIYSFNWVQNLVPSQWIVQPYFVLGGGKMRRILTREYPEFAVSQTVVQNVTTGTAGLGTRIFLTKRMAIKGEAKTYVPRFRFSKWKESQQFSVGLSWVF
jgi:hypothetical protein